MWPCLWRLSRLLIDIRSLGWQSPAPFPEQGFLNKGEKLKPCGRRRLGQGVSKGLLPGLLGDQLLEIPALTSLQFSDQCICLASLIDQVCNTRPVTGWSHPMSLLRDYGKGYHYWEILAHWKPALERNCGVLVSSSFKFCFLAIRWQAETLTQTLCTHLLPDPRIFLDPGLLTGPPKPGLKSPKL